MICLLAFGLGACNKETPIPGDGMERLTLSPAVVHASLTAEAGAPTRAAVLSNHFYAGDTLGFCIVNTGTFDPYFAGYNNIKAVGRQVVSHTPAYYDTWSYTPAGTVSKTDYVGVFRNRGDIDIYGYHPYNKTVTDITAIPFTVSTIDSTHCDYMWSANTNVDLTTPGAVTEVSPLFRHAMTLLEFRLSTSYVGPMTVSSIELEASEPVFCLNGTYSAVDGTIAPDPLSLTDKLTIVYGSHGKPKTVALTGSTPAYTSCCIMVPEISVDAAATTKLKVTFKFDSDKPLYHQGGSYEFNLKDVVTTTGDGPKYGFIKEWSYVFGVKIDNFIKYSGYPVPVSWGDEVQPEIIF